MDKIIHEMITERFDAARCMIERKTEIDYVSVIRYISERSLYTLYCLVVYDCRIVIIDKRGMQDIRIDKKTEKEDPQKPQKGKFISVSSGDMFYQHGPVLTLS